MTPNVKDRKTQKKRKPLSPAGVKFLGGAFTPELTDEISTQLSNWQNRKWLKGVVLKDYFQNPMFSGLLPKLHEILEKKGIWNPDEACVSAWLLGLLPMEQTDKVSANKILLKTISKDYFSGGRFGSHLFRAFLRTLQISFLVVSTILVLMLVISALFGDLRTWDIGVIIQACLIGVPLASFFLSIPLFPFGIAISAVTDNDNRTKINALATLSLGRLGFVESVGALAKEGVNNSWEKATPAFEALLKILPQIGPEWRYQFPMETIPELSKLLSKLNFLVLFQKHQFKKEEDRKLIEDLVLAILEVFEKAGDGRALKSVTDVTKEAMSEAVWKMAMALLPILKERAQMENDRHLLLRGSQAPARLNELLQPAMFTPEMKEGELLRPAQNEPEPFKTQPQVETIQVVSANRSDL